MLVNIKANTIYKTFLLNSLSVSLISITAIHVRNFIDKNFDLFDSSKSFLTFIVTFLTSLIVYFLMFFIFGYNISK